MTQHLSQDSPHPITQLASLINHTRHYLNLDGGRGNELSIIEMLSGCWLAG